jgi:hypothetical protein
MLSERDQLLAQVVNKIHCFQKVFLGSRGLKSPNLTPEAVKPKAQNIVRKGSYRDVFGGQWQHKGTSEDIAKNIKDSCNKK